MAFALVLGETENDVIITETLNGVKNRLLKGFKKYKIQRIDGLKKVTPPKEVYDRIRKK